MTTILVSTWEEGLWRIEGANVVQELDVPCVRGLTTDGDGGVLAILGGHAIGRRSQQGEWTEVARCEADLACCLAADGTIYAGTNDARVLRLGVDGALHSLLGFDRVDGRQTWYAGQAMVDGAPMGPPLGVRSMTATADGALLVNVHVGGIPRSADGGATWKPTLAVEADVHQVLAHPTRPELAIAATAEGLAVSRDGGVSWRIETDGLDATHGLAVVFGRRDLLVSTAVDPFSDEGAVYRRPIDGEDPLRRVKDSLPGRLAVDTDGMAALGTRMAIVDKSGRLFVSDDDGEAWMQAADGLPFPSGILILP